MANTPLRDFLQPSSDKHKQMLHYKKSYRFGMSFEHAKKKRKSTNTINLEC